MKTPTTYKIAIGVLIFQITLTIMLVVIMAIALNSDAAEGSFLYGFRDQVLHRLKVGESNPDFMLGEIVGSVFLPFITATAALLFMKLKYYVPTLISLVIGFLMGFNLIMLIPLVLIVINPARDYIREYRDSDGFDELLREHMTEEEEEDWV